MNTQVWLIRHGETEWNKAGKFQGCKNISLSSEGILQAKYLKNKFNNKFDYIYTSPLDRALKTAEIISEETNIKPVELEGIKEINFGLWEGLTINQIQNQYNVEYKAWTTDETEAKLMGGDLSIKNASIRAKDAILKVAKKCIGKNIIIVAHGGIIKAGLIGIFDWKMTMYHKIALGNTSVTKIIFDDSFNSKLIYLNDTSHLPSDYKIKSYV